MAGIEFILALLVQVPTPTVLDVQKEVNVVLGMNYTRRLDMNLDGKNDVIDVVQVISQALNGCGRIPLAVAPDGMSLTLLSIQDLVPPLIFRVGTATGKVEIRIKDGTPNFNLDFPQSLSSVSGVGWALTVNMDYAGNPPLVTIPVVNGKFSVPIWKC